MSTTSLAFLVLVTLVMLFNLAVYFWIQARADQHARQRQEILARLAEVTHG